MLITPFIRISIWVFIVQTGIHSPKHFHWKEQIQAGQANHCSTQHNGNSIETCFNNKTGKLTSIKPLNFLSITNRMREVLELTELLCSRITDTRYLHWAKRGANDVIQGLWFTGLNHRTKMIKGIYREVKPNWGRNRKVRSWRVQQKANYAPYQQRPHSDFRTHCSSKAARFGP